MEKYLWWPHLWIQKLVKSKTFIDVGGASFVYNEKVSIAHESGAKNVTMLDIAGLYSEDKVTSEEAWDGFHQKMKQEGVKNYFCIKANIDDGNIDEQYDIVHCNGIIYHTPNPLHTLNNLSKITKEFLILGTARIPDVVEVDGDKLVNQPNSCLFVPNLNTSQKNILTKFFASQGEHKSFFGLNQKINWSLNNYHGWWHLMTDGYVEGLIKIVGFEIVDTTYFWGEAARYYLCKKKNMIKCI